MGRGRETPTPLKMEVQIISWTGEGFLYFPPFLKDRAVRYVSLSLGVRAGGGHQLPPPSPVKRAPSVLATTPSTRSPCSIMLVSVQVHGHTSIHQNGPMRTIQIGCKDQCKNYCYI